MDFENPEFLLFLKCAQQNNLRYMCIGGYAVNYHGYNRTTEDLDIWIAPTNENKICFIKTLACMGYAENETDVIAQEDFTGYFMCSLGERPHVIDVLTIVHRDISFDVAEQQMHCYTSDQHTNINFIPYNILKEMKLRAARDKDFQDVARLEEIRKNNQP